MVRRLTQPERLEKMDKYFSEVVMPELFALCDAESWEDVLFILYKEWTLRDWIDFEFKHYIGCGYKRLNRRILKEILITIENTAKKRGSVDGDRDDFVRHIGFI